MIGDCSPLIMTHKASIKYFDLRLRFNFKNGTFFNFLSIEDVPGFEDSEQPEDCLLGCFMVCSLPFCKSSLLFLAPHCLLHHEAFSHIIMSKFYGSSPEWDAWHGRTTENLKRWSEIENWGRKAVPFLCLSSSLNSALSQTSTQQSNNI